MSKALNSFEDNLRVIVIGANGGIGQALIKRLVDRSQISQIYALSRQGSGFQTSKISNMAFDFTNADNLITAANTLREHGPFDLIIVTTGLLQGQGIAPEKNIRDMSYNGFTTSFAVNTIGPAMTAKYFLPLLRRDRKTVFAAFSARVGSISDNELGGWYAYRASKAALNMVIKTLAIEYKRRFKETIIMGLHPGTVDTKLSKPFQGNVPEGKLFTPDYSAEKLLDVIDSATPDYSGMLYDWAGKRIEF